MRRLTFALGLAALLVGFSAPAAHAQQSISLYGGIFAPDGYGSRDHEDVLINNTDFLAFDLGKFVGGTFGGEYLVGLGDFLDAGLGVGFYQQTVPSVYADFVGDNGQEIRQDLKLRIVPMTATIRFLPFGRQAPIQPYIGAGVGIFAFHYSEKGDFIFPGNVVDYGEFEGSGTAVGPVILGGVRFPAGAWSVGGEIRWQDAKGDLPADQLFAGDKIDLGGWTYLATFNIHF
jgi:hypothetical protein